MHVTEDYILSLLEQATKDKPVSRTEISEKAHMTDRAVRNTIGELREQGHRIIGTSDSKGYWIAKTEAEYKDFRRNYASKANRIFKRLHAMDNYCKGQTEVRDVLL